MAELTVRMVEESTGLNRSTIHRYIRDGKIQATKRPIPNSGLEEYVIEESELAKLPKPYKKHNQPDESAVLPLQVQKALEVPSTTAQAYVEVARIAGEFFTKALASIGEPSTANPQLQAVG